jgi:HEAT repeat protein
MIRFAWLPSLLLAATLLGCSGEVTEEDLDKWTHNDIGLQRITEVVADPMQPVPTCVRALEKVVERGFSAKIRSMLDEIKDPGRRAEIVKGLTVELLDKLEKGDAAQLDAKDALLSMDRYIAAEDYEQVKASIAKWAFKEVNWEAPAETVQKLGERMSVGQIQSLEKHGWEALAVLVSHGFKVDKGLEVLSGAKDPEATKLMLKGLKKHHEAVGAKIHHLQALAATEDPDAASYLLDIYLDEKNEADIRATAFNATVGMLDKPGLKANAKEIVDRLLKLMEGKNPDDRWIAALNIIHIDGAARLPDVLSRFKDDKVYQDSEVDVRKSIVDLCLDIRDKGYAPQAIPVFTSHVTDANPVVASISITCLKALEAFDAKPAITALVKPPEDPTNVSLADFLGEGYTLSILAQNAAEGLDLLKQAADDHAAKKLDDVELKNRKLLVIFEMKEVGEPLKAAVDQRFADFQSEYKQNPEAFKN